MYKLLNLNETDLRILAIFTQGFNRQIYVREMAREAEVSVRTAQIILEKFEKKGVLKSQTRGKIKLYGLQKNFETHKYLILAEAYKLASFLEQKDVLNEVINELSDSVEGIGIVFGSYVKGINKKNSDLDIFVEGNVSLQRVQKIGEKYGVEINVKRSKKEFFCKESVLQREILDSHIVFKGLDKFLEDVLNG